MTQAPLTRNQKKVLDQVPATTYSSVGSINRQLGRPSYDQGGTRNTLDSLAKRGLVLKTNGSYRRKATTPKSSTSRSPTPTFRSPVIAATPPKKEILKSVTEFWVDPNDLVTDDPGGMIDTTSKIYRSGNDKLTFRLDEDSYFVLRLNDTIAALEALRDKPVSQLRSDD